MVHSAYFINCRMAYLQPGCNLPRGKAIPQEGDDGCTLGVRDLLHVVERYGIARLDVLCRVKMQEKEVEDVFRVKRRVIRPKSYGKVMHAFMRNNFVYV